MASEVKLDKLTLQFIGSALGHEAPEVFQLAGDASSRRYYRVVVGEHSYVLMVWEPFVDDENYPFLNVLNHFEKNGIQVPKVVAKSPQLGVILLEDLGDLTLERKFWENQNHSLALPFYEQTIDELLKIHYAATNDKTSNCVAFKVSFNVEKLLWELNYGRDHLLEKFCRIKLTDPIRKELDGIFLDICTYLDNVDKVICHRDFHSRNVMLKLGKARIIDFQDARLGTIQYDLVSLVHDSYVDIDEDFRSKVLDYYLNKAKEIQRKPIPRDQFFEIFRIQTIQRCFKACGSFSSFFNMREDRRYLKYLGPTIKKVVETAEQYPQYKAFASLLKDNGLLEKDFLNPEGTK